MTHVAVQQGNGTGMQFPLLNEIAKQFEAVRHRAFELFESRGFETGHDLDDWLKAERDILCALPPELVETDGVFHLQIALPGFDVNDVEVTATPTEIMVHAASSREKKSEEEETVWTEFASNDVFRLLPVPDSIDTEKTVATLDKGILCITAPTAAVTGKLLSAAKAA